MFTKSSSTKHHPQMMSWLCCDWFQICHSSFSETTDELFVKLSAYVWVGFFWTRYAAGCEYTQFALSLNHCIYNTTTNGLTLPKFIIWYVFVYIKSMKQDALYCWNFCIILNMFLCCINKVLNIKIRSCLYCFVYTKQYKLFLSFRLFLASMQQHVALSYLQLDNSSAFASQQHQHHKPAPNL